MTRWPTPSKWRTGFLATAKVLAETFMPRLYRWFTLSFISSLSLWKLNCFCTVPESCILFVVIAASLGKQKHGQQATNRDYPNLMTSPVPGWETVCLNAAMICVVFYILPFSYTTTVKWPRISITELEGIAANPLSHLQQIFVYNLLTNTSNVVSSTSFPVNLFSVSLSSFSQCQS